MNNQHCLSDKFIYGEFLIFYKEFIGEYYRNQTYYSIKNTFINTQKGKTFAYFTTFKSLFAKHNNRIEFVGAGDET